MSRQGKKTKKPLEHSGQNLQALSVTPRSDWHQVQLAPLPHLLQDNSSVSQKTLTDVQAHAESLLLAENERYAKQQKSSSSSQQFLATIVSSGTLSDKISALTLAVQDSPLHNVKAFENLLNLARKRSRGQAVTALGALKDLLAQGTVLPADRKLKLFSSQPGLLSVLKERKGNSWTPGDSLHNDLTDQHLIHWAYEDWLKKTFFEILKLLEGWSNDEVVFARSRAVGYCFELLKEKPEQEANLLRLLVNKLGDRERKIASTASYLLLQLQVSHPLMKPIIVSTIESELIFRPGQNSHAKYYGIITLNQMTLSGKESEIASRLLEVYFTLFVSLLRLQEKKGEQPTEDLAPKFNSKGQVQGGGGKPGHKARRKILREESAKYSEQEFNEKIISAVLTGVNRAFPFADADDETLLKHLNTLFRITHSSNFNTSIQALMLIQQISASKQFAADRFYRTLYESLLDSRLIGSSKQAMYLNLLYRALNADVDVKRVTAFVKRLLQIIMLHQPAFVCGVLYLIKQLEQNFPGLRSNFDRAEESPEENDEDEHFVDVPEDSALPRSNETSKFEKPSLSLRSERQYDGRRRNPEHSNADKSCFWEMAPLTAHFHPSASLFASRLLENEEMPPKPDLSLHSLMHFLDRFVYRNAKANTKSRGIAIMQPLAGGFAPERLSSSRDTSRTHAPVNAEDFWSRKLENVPVDEVFFHKYFNQAGSKKNASKKRKRDADDSGASGSDKDEEDAEDEIWKALVESKPDIEGDKESGSDLEMEGFDSVDESLSLEDDSDGASIEGEGSDVEIEGLANGTGTDEDEVGDDELENAFEELPTAEEQEAEPSKSSSKRDKRKKLNALPTFASVDDYAEMLASEDEG